MPTQFKTSTRVVHLGSLGVITALDISAHGSEHVTCTYIGGLPYALPPTGDHRFRPPRPLPSGFQYGSSTKPASYIGRTAVCPQPSSAGPVDPSSWDEDCLQLNIWIPSGNKPPNGWPIFFYIHGGWLQSGTANTPANVIANLFHDTPFKAVVVMPCYRLNVFGFLAGPDLEAEARSNGETVGNMGFWDQRMALEWVKTNASSLSGDKDRTTVGGYSAGSHSAFRQLAHDLNRPKAEQCIGRVIMWSNGPGLPAKGPAEHLKQYEELLGRLGISLKFSASERISQLRALPIEKLVAVQSQMTLSEFRALDDGVFIPRNIHQRIDNGTFAKNCKARNIKILNGECSEEWNAYGSYRTPGNSYDAVFTRLVAEYRRETVSKIMHHYFPSKKLPTKYKDWRDAFGKVYADMQVYAMERGFAHKLDEHGFKAGTSLLRYRLEWRAKCVANVMPPEWGVTHGTDMAIWFWGGGLGSGLTENEKKTLARLNQVFADFVGFADVQWPVKGPEMQLRLDEQGTVEMAVDPLYQHGVDTWRTLVTEDMQLSKL
ncbi:hypothetical protein ANO11243_036540 [Dothideomycetidae sp. 11243]|nr:hypothetical protein ANO11243_036540 [fungal sp. No.11243]